MCGVKFENHIWEKHPAEFIRFTVKLILKLMTKFRNFFLKLFVFEAISLRNLMKYVEVE